LSQYLPADTDRLCCHIRKGLQEAKQQWQTPLQFGRFFAVLGEVIVGTWFIIPALGKPIENKFASIAAAPINTNSMRSAKRFAAFRQSVTITPAAKIYGEQKNE
jgi:hypothetical protein